MIRAMGKIAIYSCPGCGRIMASGNFLCRKCRKGK